ncbi:CapA family protein [Streptococcaceae bacterium ESL0687]|nr:CapA family protein [Streptococcaceae bacterium ESL0687]
MENKQHFSLKKSVTVALVATAIVLPLVLLVSPGLKKSETMAESKETTTNKQKTAKKKDTSSQKKETTESKKAKITASGDMLYHNIVYGSAWDGSRYDFDNDYELVKPLISSADLALGDFEGTINPQRELAGYPIFNAPEEVLSSIKDAGFDVLDLGHNHILDTGLSGLTYTANAIKKAGMDYIGVSPNDDQILVKDVNGIKIALLAYSYGFNGIEQSISTEDYNKYLKDLNPEKVQAEIKKAKEMADFVIVMPQMGEEYRLSPTDEQVNLYHQMIDWGADIIFGGHPHVIEPTEIIDKNGDKKFIIYSMGNLLSNQRYETLENYWTERGVIMDLDLEKTGDKTSITSIKAHPTWVSREPIPGRYFEGYQAYDYQVLLAEDYLPGGKYANSLGEEKRSRIETAYQETMDLLNLKWPQ